MKSRFKGYPVASANLLVAACLTLVCFETLRADCVSSPPGLVAWWRAENNALDQFGANHGTLFNGATFAPGLAGQAFSFDGQNDLVQIPDAPSLNPATITLEAWVNPSTIKADSRIVSKELQVSSCAAPYVSYSLDIRADQGTHAIFYYTTTNNMSLHQLTGTSIIPVNQFTHIAATYDGTTARLYVNGVLENTLMNTGSICPSATPVTIGNAGAACRADFAGTVEFAGIIDEVSLYSRALTAAEILALFNASSAGKCTTPSLKIVLTPTNTIVVSWPSPSTDFGLQQNTNSVSSVNWSNVTAITDNGTNKFIIVSPTTGNRFYRLLKP